MEPCGTPDLTISFFFVFLIDVNNRVTANEKHTNTFAQKIFNRYIKKAFDHIDHLSILTSPS